MKLRFIISALLVAILALVAGARTLRADDAAKNLKKAIKHYRRASGLVDKGKLDKAIAEYRKALRLRPDDAYWHLALGLALMRKGHGEQARDELQFANQLAPGLHGPSERMLDEMQRRRAGQPGPASGTSGVYMADPDVTAPLPVYKPEPPYSEEARLASYQGTALLFIVVDAQGNVSDIAVVKPLGVGLDEKAVQTVSTWRFRPATRGGVPVPVRAAVEVSFKLF